VLPKNRDLGSIFNNDINNILCALDGKNATPDDYRRMVDAILDMRPGVLAQNVGMPDPVIYRSGAATTWDKHLVEVTGSTWSSDLNVETARREAGVVASLLAAGTDPLTITIEESRKRGVLMVASYRMNAEDWYHNSHLLSDFGRAHPEWRIPLTEAERALSAQHDTPAREWTGVLDYAMPQVSAQRQAIFREVAERYDIDGIEFDFRRWCHMISNPLENHPVLTKLVRETRKMLDEVAAKKGRERLLLGVRVGPSLDSEPNPFLFPGIYYDQKPTNASCRELGLDVTTWIKDALVDYVCPSLFLPSLPGLPLTREFAALAKGTDVGIYPTVFPLAAWMHGVCERTVTLEDKDRKALALYKHDLCTTVLKAYADGADGISTFNWYAHLRNARAAHLWCEASGESSAGSDAVQTHLYPMLGDPHAVREYRQQPSY
jgi:hypothetical protein